MDQLWLLKNINDDIVLVSVESVGKLDSNHLDNVASQDPDTSNDNLDFRVEFPDQDVSSEGYMNCSKRSKKVIGKGNDPNSEGD